MQDTEPENFVEDKGGTNKKTARYAPIVIAVVVLVVLVGKLAGVRVTLPLSYGETTSFSNPVVCLESSVQIDGKPGLSRNVSLGSLELMNRSLEVSYESFRESPNTQNEATVADSLRNRRKAFTSAIVHNPRAAFLMVLPDQMRQDLSRASTNCVEREVDVRGTLEILHSHLTDERYSINNYVLVTTRGERLRLYPTKETDLISGAYVRVRGYQIDDMILADSSSAIDDGNSNSGINPLSGSGFDAVTGDQKIVVLITYNSDSPVPERSPEDFEEIIGGMDEFFSEVSYEKASISGGAEDVFGPYRFDYARCPGRNLSIILDEAIEAADDEVDFNDYDIILLSHSRCHLGAATGSLGYTTVRTDDGDVEVGVIWMDNSDWRDNDEYARIVQHEMGHNFGNHHADFLRCGTDAVLVDQYSECDRQDYGDKFDSLGGPVAHFNAWHKVISGWLSPPNIIDVSSSGRYTLEPIEIITGGLQALRIPRRVVDNGVENKTDYLFVEYRQPIGQDINIAEDCLESDSCDSTNIFEGALLHTAFEDDRFSYMLDTSPPSVPAPRTEYNPVLEVGQIFRDPAGITLRTNSATDQLSVDLSYDRVDLTPPQATIVSPRNNVEAGVRTVVRVPYLILVEASDDVAVDKVDFQKYVTGEDYSVVRETFASKREAPYYTVVDESGVSFENRNYNIEAQDTAGNAIIPNDSSKLEVQLRDRIAPVYIVSPEDGGTVPTTFTIEVDPSYPPYRVGHVEFWSEISTVPLHIDTEEPYVYEATLPEGSHWVWAVAKYFAGDRHFHLSYSPAIRVDVVDESEPVDPPEVSIYWPLEGSQVVGPLGIQALASSDVGIDKVEFFEANNGSLGEDFSDPYTAVWDVRDSVTGEIDHLLGATALDIEGNRGLSNELRVRVRECFREVDGTCQRFDDVGVDHSFFEHIHGFVNAGISSGCSTIGFCPTISVTRGQMAVFTIRAMHERPSATDVQTFEDVPREHLLFGFIERMNELGIDDGCDIPNHYCPTDPVIRSEAAEVIVKALGEEPVPLSDPREPTFTDVPRTHESWGYIEKIKELGIISGCTADKYCPDFNVTRGQAAVYFVNGFEIPTGFE